MRWPKTNDLLSWYLFSEIGKNGSSIPKPEVIKEFLDDFYNRNLIDIHRELSNLSEFTAEFYHVDKLDRSYDS